MAEYEDLMRLRDEIAKLLPSEREWLMEDYCPHCFIADLTCQCWNTNRTLP